MVMLPGPRGPWPLPPPVIGLPLLAAEGREGPALWHDAVRGLTWRLVVDGIKDVTAAAYGKEIGKISRLIWRWSPIETLASWVIASAWQAISVWGTLYVQLCYDSQLSGLSEAQNLVAGLKRVLASAQLRIVGNALLDLESPCAYT